MKRFLLSFVLLFCSWAWAGKWIDSSHTYLLPPGVGEPLKATGQFSLFWWNFVIVEFEHEPVWEGLDGFCKALARESQGLVQKMACGQDLAQFGEVLRDWALDLPRRQEASSTEKLKQGFAQALTRAALPMDRPMLELVRQDPLASYQDLRQRLEKNTQLDFETRFGYFYEESTRRVVLPVQFAFEPSQSAKTSEFMRILDRHLPALQGGHLAAVIGPQASTLENESQIYKDVHLISLLGAFLLLAQVGAAVAVRRWRLLFLAPPVLLSTALSALITALLFGGIHGLTLAFGPGIVGLAMDHGLHSCLNPTWRGAWRANWYGLLTTIAALVALMMSSIPFLRQLMAFSIIGLLLGFLFYWFLHRRYPDWFMVEPLPITPRPSRARFAVIGVLMLGFVVGLFTLKPNLNLQQMSFQTAREAEVTKWFFAHLRSKSPLLQISQGEEPLAEAHSLQRWAQKNGVSLENAAAYLPTEAEQAKNVQSWRDRLCFGPWLSSSERRVFAPFLEGLSCDSKDLGVRSLRETLAPSYLRDFNWQKRWVSLWMTVNDQQVRAVKAAFPEAVSLPEIVNLFPKLLAAEAGWMAVLAILLSTLLLWFYYRDFYLVGLSLIPFVCGVGLFSIIALIFQFQVSFISLIALVMIFGLSLDYGIFAANLYTGRSGPSVHGVWTSVVLAALVTFLGFVPLAFCRHPVLVQLGQALVWGTAGTILGSMWGVPSVHWMWRGRDAKTF